MTDSALAQARAAAWSTAPNHPASTRSGQAARGYGASRELGPRDPRRLSPASPLWRASPPPRLLADARSPSRCLSSPPAPRGRGQQLRLLPAHADRRAGGNRTEPPPPRSSQVLDVRLLLESTRLLGLIARLVARDAHPARHPLPGQQPVGGRGVGSDQIDGHQHERVSRGGKPKSGSVSGAIPRPRRHRDAAGASAPPERRRRREGPA